MIILLSVKLLLKKHILCLNIIEKMANFFLSKLAKSKLRKNIRDILSKIYLILTLKI